MKPDPISNRKLTLIRKLNQKKYREKERLFLLEGARAVEQVITNGIVEIEALFFDQGQHYWEESDWEKAAGQYSASVITPAHFREVSDTENPQGVLALCRMPEMVSVEELAQRPEIIVAADRIQDPGNLGTIIRTASWFGAGGLLLGKGTVDLFHPKVVRSTAGATGSIPYRNSDLKHDLKQFEKHGWRILLLDAGRESINLQTVEPAEKTILVIGNEAHGVDKQLFFEDRTKVQIVPANEEQNVESLNAAIATGIALYALTR